MNLPAILSFSQFKIIYKLWWSVHVLHLVPPNIDSSRNTARTGSLWCWPCRECEFTTLKHHKVILNYKSHFRFFRSVNMLIRLWIFGRIKLLTRTSFFTCLTLIVLAACIQKHEGSMNCIVITVYQKGIALAWNFKSVLQEQKNVILMLNMETPVYLVGDS